MRLTILKENLKEGVKIAERLIVKSLTLPILENIFLKAEKNFLLLKTTNLESGLNYWSLAKIEKEGEICIPIKILSQLINTLPVNILNFQKHNLDLLITNENYKITIKGQNPEDFPLIPKPTGSEETIEVNGAEFCESLSQVVNFTSISSIKPEISGVCLIFQKDTIKIVATDSFRLAEKKIFLESELLNEYQVILPQKTIREILSIFFQENKIKIYLSPIQIFLESQIEEISHPKIQFTSKLIEGEFPNYTEIIPKKFNTHIKLLKQEFINQLKVASYFGGKTNEIKLKINPAKKSVEITCQDPSLGEVKSVFLTEILGNELDISFNSRFLIEGILEIKTKEIIFELTDEEGPAILRSSTKDDYFYVLMPIKSS